ncbi:MAG: DNA repair exonuclease, partial [Candidatus Nanohaloarchaea archaeon]|nr:DNA repair exonuclease [Candidatus Nanohaloarchaea archaeon]
MKIAVVSDQHLGFGWDTERQDDSFRNCREAFQRCQDADVILLPGDLFDRKVPKQEVLGRAIDLFRQFEDHENDVKVSQEGKKLSFRGIPIIAIHGTHERRSEDHVNPIQLLEKMGFLAHIHNEQLLLEKEGETVAVHGMSGVPERYAPKVLQRFDPQPIRDAYNILMLHQSIENFVYTDKDQPALKLEHLPDRFDAIINGHIHWRNLDHWQEDRPLIMPGSTITTQINQIEAERPKGFLTIDTQDNQLQFHALQETREVYHREINVSGKSGSQVRQAVQHEMDDILATDHRHRPLVRIVLRGETNASISVTEIKQDYKDDALLTIGKQTTEKQQDSSIDIDHDEATAMETGMQLLKDRIHM